MLALLRRFFTRRLFSSALGNFQMMGVVPDVIDIIPDDVLKVTYPNNVTVELGNYLTPTQVKDEPEVKWKVKANCYYTLCMTDPDAPSRREPHFREWHHWLVVNIPKCNMCKGQVLSEYIGAGPPPGTGFHRYVFLVFLQKRKMKFDEKRLPNTSAEFRGGFSIRKFADKYQLGSPVAGNLFQAEFDDYVPILYKQLGF